MFDPIQEKAKYWAETLRKERDAIKKAQKRAYDAYLKREIKVTPIDYEPDVCAHDQWLEQGNDNQIRNGYMVNESTSTL
jgi:hypothetical protein